MEAVGPVALSVTVGTRDVPAVMWSRLHDRDDVRRPLVLIGHGGNSHKSAARQHQLATHLVALGMSVVAIDGPAHGERALRAGQAPGEYQAALAARGVASVVSDMVDDWRAAIDAARAAAPLDRRLGYVGLSMGARFGLPLAAALGEQLTCAVLGKLGLSPGPSLHPALHIEADLRRDAERVVSPTLWHMQWEDELFPRTGQLDLFDALGTDDKRLVAFPGGHGGEPDDALDTWTSFLCRHLGHPDPR